MALLLILVVGGVFAGMAGASTATGLVGWWKLNETTGTTAYDSSGLGNNGTINSPGVTLGVPGVLGTAYSFAGTTTSSVAIPTTAALRPTRLTLAVWVKPTSLDCIGGNACAVVSNEGPSTGPAEYGYGLRIFPSPGGPNRGVQWCIGRTAGTGNCAYTNTDGGALIGVWTLIVCTYDSTTGAMKVYVNGALQATANSGIGALTTTQPLYIGRLPDTNYYLSWKGAIDNLQIFERVP